MGWFFSAWKPRPLVHTLCAPPSSCWHLLSADFLSNAFPLLFTSTITLFLLDLSPSCSAHHVSLAHCVLHRVSFPRPLPLEQTAASEESEIRSQIDLQLCLLHLDVELWANDRVLGSLLKMGARNVFFALTICKTFRIAFGTYLALHLCLYIILTSLVGEHCFYFLFQSTSFKNLDCWKCYILALIHNRSPFY